MQITLLLPSSSRVAASLLQRWLVRGDRMADVVRGRETALCECFAIEAATLPIAALTRNIDAGRAGESLWLRADPAFVMADAVTLRLLACGNLGLSPEDIEMLTPALQPLFAASGFVFDAPQPQRWYVRCPRDATLPKFSPPDDALGDDFANHLPEGGNARKWRALLNEAQIVLTQHPLNAQRARRGVPPVNSLWFWGAGALPQQVRCKFDRIASDDEVVVSLANLGEVPLSSRREFAFSLTGGKTQERSILVDLADQRDIVKLDDEWFKPVAEGLQRGRVAQLDLLFESGERYVVKPAHLWRFWRRAKATA